MSSLPIQQMTWEEKLQAMEELWDSLRQDEGRLASPTWHEDALKETEARYQAGLEKPIPWAEAKRDLLKRAE